MGIPVVMGALMRVSEIKGGFWRNEGSAGRDGLYSRLRYAGMVWALQQG